MNAKKISFMQAECPAQQEELRSAYRQACSGLGKLRELARTMDDRHLTPTDKQAVAHLHAALLLFNDRTKFNEHL